MQRPEDSTKRPQLHPLDYAKPEKTDGVRWSEWQRWLFLLGLLTIGTLGLVTALMILFL